MIFPTIHITIPNPIKVGWWLPKQIKINLGDRTIKEILQLLKKNGVNLDQLVEVYEGLSDD